MQLHRQSIINNTKGFTFAELLLAIGLLTVIMVLVVPAGIGYLHTYALVTQRDVLTNLLLSARSRALTHAGQGPYSVYVDNTKYVLFQGAVFNEASTTNEVTRVAGNIAHTPASTVISFALLSGKSMEQTFSLQSNGHSVSLHINAEGVIE